MLRAGSFLSNSLCLNVTLCFEGSFMSTLSKPSSFLWIILPRLVGPLGRFHQEFD